MSNVNFFSPEIKFKGKPIEKLIETISNGLGTLYKPISIKNTARAEATKKMLLADAKAYEIKVLNKAETDAKLYDLELLTDAFSRVKDRLVSREIQRQLNFDSIIKLTEEQLRSEVLSNEPVDPDWTKKFFDYASDVSDEDLKKIWSKILAGEIKEPKSFSLRTLSKLSELSKFEAKTFKETRKFILESSGYAFLINSLNGWEINDNNIKCDFKKIEILNDAQIVYIIPSLSLNIKKSDDYSIFNIGSTLLKFKPIQTNLSFQIHKLTPFGYDLLKIIDFKPNFKHLISIKEILEQFYCTEIQYKNESMNEFKYLE